MPFFLGRRRFKRFLVELSDPKDYARFRSAMGASRKKLRSFRESRRASIAQYVGSNYSEDGASDKVPVNLIEMMVVILLGQLAARAPKALVKTPIRGLKPEAANLELGLNRLLDQIQLAGTLRRSAMDALFSVGVVKVGLCQKTTLESDGYTHHIGQPFADVVDLDDIELDMTAKRFDQVSFVGNRYRLPYLAVKDSSLYDLEVLKKLKPSPRSGTMDDGEEKVESIGQGGESGEEDECEDHVELIDVWLPFDRKVVTMDADNSCGRPLRVVDWEGPDCGPYHWLAFVDVPNNLMPLSTVSVVYDLADLSNRLFLKAGRQAERQKTVFGFRGSAADDAERLIKAKDGGSVRIDDSGPGQEFKTGGADQVTLAMFLQAKGLFTYLAGNLDALGGLSPQAGTLGQDQLLSVNASRRVSEMQNRMVEFSRGVINSLAWYLLNDPLIDMKIAKRVPGYESIEVPVDISPENRKGDYLDFNFDVEPYSAQDVTPGQRLQTLTMFFQQFLVPFAPMLAQSGIQINFQGLLKLVAKYSNIDELSDILTMAIPPEEPDVQGEKGRKMSPVTRRENVRINRPGSTEQGKDEAMMQMMLGGANGVQPASLAGLARQTA